ncbi:MAG: tryptophan--tRNA ligase [Sulfobacillus acidophilus]|uniref:Tryptophan--tRNA ligase n=1 Tax=Sulfobacillus acidophilus TaxID=53633 RepID=A0A2T2WHB3_9FIRM|nr:MAG: tryptophan--tRNA ligase [Sulfobacillus acidophilus]
MSHEIVLTGIKPTGMPHLGNWVGAIRPTVELSRQAERQGFFFIADYHALTGLKDGKQLRRFTYSVAAAWIALGLDPDRIILYRQSDIPEVFELSWILACFSPKGLMNRAHAYKAQVQKNQESGESDLDSGVNMGLYTYPILMAADILVMGTHRVPVGSDQQQHVEIARDLAQYFNRQYGRDIFTLPEALIDPASAVLPGIDGRKMSKSYKNYIPLFDAPDAIKKLIMRIETDSSQPGDPKDPDSSTIFQLYRVLANPAQTESLARAYASGIAWKDAKEELWARFDETFREPTRRYQELMANPAELDKIFAQGADKARAQASRIMTKVRRAVGTR